MHYVCSDIHGKYDDYIKMLDKINFSDNDIMYVIGDVIDRGPRPIDILLDIMNRKNIILLIGNHEHMMIQSELYNDRMQLYDWMRNGAETTLIQLDSMKESDKTKLLVWLTRQRIIIPNLKVADRNYYLAHACHTLTDDHEERFYYNTPLDVIHKIVWNRTYRAPVPADLDYRFHNLYLAYPNTTLLIGHNIVQKCSYGITNNVGQGRISRARKGHLINLDCGCARGSSLGCLRLEDGKEFYV